MHHVPHTGDLPNTLMTSAHSAIRLEPINYLEHDSSVQINQQVKVNHTSGEIERFGSQNGNCSVDMVSVWCWPLSSEDTNQLIRPNS